MTFDFLLGPYALGFLEGEVRRLNPLGLCDDPRGLSGTEVNALGLAHALADLGHEVRLWSSWTEEVCREGAGRLLFRQLADGQSGPPAEVAIAFHDPQPMRAWQAPYKLIWHQTVTPPEYVSMRRDQVDGYISATLHNAWCLSQYASPSTPWKVIANGWNFGTYCRPHPVPGRLFYHTSPERGLHVLLNALVLIQRQVPKAHLVVWCRLETARGHHDAIWQQIVTGLRACGESVEVHGEGGSRNQVLQALSTAQVFAYPSEPNAPCEVMPMSVLEACATGVPVVCAPSDKFDKAFGKAIDVCPAPPSAHLETFVAHVCRVLTEPRWAQTLRERGVHFAAKRTFNDAAAHLLEWCAAAPAH